ncbi:hypothetical protein [uncultured Trichococcus sp.]|uniref:hypothetical protein n=1 Tax=uncultured Trichococcus sp. TaxID=189665 RepID=UPI0029C93A3C|nr:hypothetical protein [uncultured Trichococcus sp.]
MKKIKDERLILRNLMNIRIAWIVQNLAILIFLGYQVIKSQETSGVFTYGNPLWAVFSIGTYTLIFLSVNVSGPMEDKEKMTPKKITFISLGVFLITTIFFYFAFLQVHPLLALISGIVVATIIYGLLRYANRFRNE